MSDDDERLVSARDLVDPSEVRELLRSAKSGDAVDAPIDLDTLAVFRTAARELKAAELAFIHAQKVYGDAVKRLSDEAVK